MLWDRWSPAVCPWWVSLTLFSLWQTGTARALLLLWSGPAFFLPGLLVCVLELPVFPIPKRLFPVSTFPAQSRV